MPTSVEGQSGSNIGDRIRGAFDALDAQRDGAITIGPNTIFTKLDKLLSTPSILDRFLPSATEAPAASATAASPTATPASGSGGLSADGMQKLYVREAQAGVSNHLHWPKAASGVTLGPGYDMKGKTEDQIVTDLTAIGVDKASAEAAAKGAGLSGTDARDFAANNRDLITLTNAQEKQLLANTVKGYADHVAGKITTPVTQNQFDAMVSFAYNIGKTGFDGSTALTRLNAGDAPGAAEAMKLWNKSDGKVSQGLVNRRASEIEQFNTPSGPAAGVGGSGTVSLAGGDAVTGRADANTAAALAVMIDAKGDAQAQADLANGQKVVLALRSDTNVNVNGGKGAYDDQIAVVWKDANGVAQAQLFKGNTEPSGQYSTEGPKAAKGSTTDMDGDGRADLGRLAAGTIRYQQQAGNFLGNTFFRATATQTAQRDTNHDGNFDAADTNRIDTKGAGNSMLIHQGGPKNTWSAGCQTIPSADFNAFVDSLGGQKAFSYVLVDAN